ncbi:hypothetical protein Tsubulata_008094 [Turnera subulata]|uniref:Ribosome-inactivating protein n=1 Tax=Turnera subulata TaxID=218843 RepID=A0A9Q0FDX5_9ROSI|nr:hypothetical protein Tsubulata_008094 [Turnera subulata]
MEGRTWRGGTAAATWLWLLALISGSQYLVVGSIEDDVALGPKLTKPASVFDLTSIVWKAQYGNLIINLQRLGSGHEGLGIPVLLNPKQVPDEYQRFVLAKLISYNKIAVTLAIDVTTANVAGYEARSKYYCFKDTRHLPRPIPFKDTTTEVVELGFRSTYTGLEEAAAAKREGIELSFKFLSDAIESLEASSSSDRERARALIVVLQMVCDVARFRSFHQRLLTTYDTPLSFKPDAAMIGLQDNWNRLSTTIQQSYQRAFNNPLPIKRGDGELFFVDSVSDILKANLQLLKFNCTSGRGDRLSSSSSSSSSSESSSSSFTTKNPLRQVVISTSEDDGIDTNVVYGGDDLCPELEPTTRIVGRDGLCVVVQDSDPTDGNKIILDDCEFDHFWTFKRDGTIRWNDKCLTGIKIFPNQSSNNNDQTINITMVIYDCSTAPSVSIQWNVTTDGSIVSIEYDDLSLTAPAGQGTPLTLEDTVLSSAQAWLPTNHYQPFRAAISDIFSAGYLRLKEGDDRVLVIERLRNGRKITRDWAIYADGTIRPVSALHRCLTLTLGKVEIENRVVLEDCIGSYKQRWMFRSNGFLVNPESGLILGARQDSSVLTPIGVRPLDALNDRLWLPLL